MRWEQLDNNNGFHFLTIEAQWPEISDDYNDILSGYEKAPVPGFRTGKAPKALIEKRFEKEISAQLTQQVAQRLGREAVREAGIEVLGPAEAEEIECAKDQIFRAKVRFHPMPEIDLPDLKSLLNGEADKDPRDRISLRLLELVHFDIPDVMVEDELALDGVDDLEPGSAQWEGARSRIRLILILKQIAKREGVEVDEVDVDNRIAEKAKEFGTSTKDLKMELNQGMGMQRLKDMLLAESVLGYLTEINI